MAAAPVTPTEAMDAGRCMWCLGTGATFSITDDAAVVCRMCGGTGALADLLERLATDTIPDGPMPRVDP